MSRDATGEEIKAAYRRGCRRWHPDRNSSPEAAGRFREIQEAYTQIQGASGSEVLTGKMVDDLAREASEIAEQIFDPARDLDFDRAMRFGRELRRAWKIFLTPTQD